jgi:hypothetical protein
VLTVQQYKCTLHFSVYFKENLGKEWTFSVISDLVSRNTIFIRLKQLFSSVGTNMYIHLIVLINKQFHYFIGVCFKNIWPEVSILASRQ